MTRPPRSPALLFVPLLLGSAFAQDASLKLDDLDALYTELVPMYG